jgi:hypothetical protein
MIEVCKYVEVTRKALHCVGTKEFRTCNEVVVTEEQPVCGEGDTFSMACADMESELREMLTKQCRSYIGCKLLARQSATDLGPTIWEKIGKIMMSCNVGESVY